MYKMIFKKKISSFIDLVKKKRFFDVAFKLSQKFPDWFIMLNKTNMFFFPGKKTDIKRFPKNCIFREADLRDLPFVISINEEADQQEIIPKLYQDYFDQGRSCYIVEHNNQIVGYCWAFRNKYILTSDNYVRSNVELMLDNKTVFFGDGYVKPAYRLRGIYPYMMSGMIDDCRRKGAEKIIANILSVNDNSRRSHVSIGFSPIKSMYYVSILTIDYLIVADMDRNKKVYKANRKIRGLI